MLKKLTIDNFKSLKHLEYDCAGLNLLTGMNGAGKSSFIQMLRIMQKISGKIGEPNFIISAKEFGSGLSTGDLKCCYADNFEMKFSVDYSAMSEPKKTYSLSRIMLDGVITSIKDGLEIQHPDWEREHCDCYSDYQRLAMLETDDEFDHYHVTHEQVENAARNAIERFAAAEKRMREEDCEKAKAFASLWQGMRFVDAFRQKPTDIHSGGRYSEYSEFLGDLSAEGFNAEGQDVAEYIYKSKGISADSNELLDSVNSCLNWVSPGARLIVKKQDVAGDEYFIESIGFGSATIERQYKPQNVGFGISYILPVLVTLLSAKPGSILIVENPEAHLHPRGQAEMGKLIAETVARGVQVFVETHSDHVINGIRVAVKKGIVKPEDVNIAFFERGPHDVPQADGTTRREIYSEVTNIKVDANGSLSEWPKDFMDEWGIQQMKLLRP